jgi:acetylornithine deacetylase/succinyl-diaminopimelate desuccinylase-like protein
MVQGGVRSNVIPDRCEMIVDARTIPGFDNARMTEAIRGAVSAEVEVLSSRLAPVQGDSEWSVVRAAVAAVPGRAVTGFKSVSDLAHLSGTPAIVFGPGTPEQSHRADESVAIESVLAAPNVYRRTIAAYFALERER